MFDTSTVKIPTNSENLREISHGIIRLPSNTKNDLIHISDNIYLSFKNNNYKIFNCNRGINIIKNTTLGFSEQNFTIPFECIEEQFKSEQIHFFLSNSRFISILNLYCNNSNWIIIDLDKQKYYGDHNYENIYRLKSYRYPFILKCNINGTIIITYRLLGVYKFNPIKQLIIHPGSQNLLCYFYSNNDIILESPNKNLHNDPFVIKPMKLLFSSDKQTWKKWNPLNNSFENISFTNSYPTFDEFINNANTLNEYYNISDSDWVNEFGENDIYVLVSSFVPLFEILHNTFNLTSDKFIYNKKLHTKNLFIKGDI